MTLLKRLSAKVMCSVKYVAKPASEKIYHLFPFIRLLNGPCIFWTVSQL